MSSPTRWLSTGFTLLCIAPLTAQRGTPVSRQVVAAGFWAEARYNYAYWDAVRANWDSAFTATVTRASETPGLTDMQLFHALRRWGALLNDGQLEILPPVAIAARVARPPLALRSIERRPFIIDYATNDEMRIARPQRLAEIITVQGVPAAQWIRDSILPEIAAATEESRWERAVTRMLEGERGTALQLLLRLPGGEQRGASVTRSVALSMRWPLEPPPLEADTLPDGAIWVRVNTLADPDVVDCFDRALGDAAGQGPRHRGVILDLRETTWTPGGREQGYAILSRLIDKPLLTSRWRTPQYRPAYRGTDTPDSSGAWLSAPSDTIWPPARRQRVPYTGPVAVLISARTAGPAEDFLVAFRGGNRGPIIGEPSAASTGQTIVVALGTGTGWQARLTVTRDALPDGKEFVRSGGIVPDLPVTERADDVLAGRDAVLDRARAYLSETARPVR
ncbi:MAG TPA: S41 family peptidase [Gemmatimonadales bacterium]